MARQPLLPVLHPLDVKNGEFRARGRFHWMVRFQNNAKLLFLLERLAVSERSESNGEMSEWFKEHAWK